MAAYNAHRSGARVMLLGGSGGASSRISSMVTALGQRDIDSPAHLFDDIYRAGGYLSNPALLAELTQRIGPETAHLAGGGVPFHAIDGALARRQTTGCTWPSSVYSLGMIGVDIARHLSVEMEKSKNPPLSMNGAVLLQINMSDNRPTCGLVYSVRDHRWLSVSAQAIVLATGGAGQLYATTTNPRGSKGTGYALALESGCELTDMEFVSFEPFITAVKGDRKGHDLPTTVLQQGAKLRNGRGEEFLDTSSAPTKDVICRSMLTEVAEGRGTDNGAIYYDIRDMDPAVVTQYVQVEQALAAARGAGKAGLLEVMPAQHYFMGGARIDARSATTVPGIFAVGEVAGGTHGGHRLAGAGGMEVVAGGAIAGENAAQFALHHHSRAANPGSNARPDLLDSTVSPAADKALKRMRQALSTGCGIFRTESGLEAAVDAIEGVLHESEGDSNLLLVTRRARVSLAIAETARRRRESRGDHFRNDFPFRDDVNWLCNQTVRLDHQGALDVRKTTDVPGMSQDSVTQ